MHRGKGNFQDGGEGKSQNKCYGTGLGTHQLELEKSIEAPRRISLGNSDD